MAVQKLRLPLCLCVVTEQFAPSQVLCLSHSGVVPVTVRPPQAQNISTTLPTVHMIVEVSKAATVLTASYVLRLLKSKVCTIIKSYVTYSYGHCWHA